jgi:hypothetical protein
MSFFESFPTRAPVPPARRRRLDWQRSDAVIPGSAPGQVIVARNDEAAVAVGSLRAYPNGFEFTVLIRQRRDDRAEDRWALDPFGQHSGRGAAEDVLRLGIMYADGRRVAADRGHDSVADDPGRLILNHNGAGGDSLSWHADFWIHPLPPDGPVTVVVSWLEQGITESRAELDGTAIRAAAQQAVTLWPEEPAAETATSRTVSAMTAEQPGSEE